MSTSTITLNIYSLKKKDGIALAGKSLISCLIRMVLPFILKVGLNCAVALNKFPLNFELLNY